MNEEILAKAKAAKSPEELIELAKENGKEMTAEEAESIFKSLSQGGELSDEELESAVGGCGGPKWNPTFDCEINRWECRWKFARYPDEYGDTGWSRWACKICGNAVHTAGGNACCAHAKSFGPTLDCSSCKWSKDNAGCY